MADIEVGAILEPPGAITCNCGDLVGYIAIPDMNKPLAVVHPCHCEMTPHEIQELMVRNHPELAEHLKDDE